MLWVEKYRPKTIEDVVADKTVIKNVLTWAEGWKKGVRQKPLLLAGPPGVGKTSLALALANTMGWEAVELNASDQRSWNIISRIVGEGAFNETISDEGEFLSSKRGKLKLIILDEVDNIHRKEDFGGESALLRIIRKTPPQPIILIANDPYALSQELRKNVVMINFKRLNKNQIARILEKICEQEGVKCDREVLTLIAENAGGDLRAAVNDLQAIAEGKKVLRPEDVVIAKRTQETDVFKVLQKIFKTKLPAHGDAMLLDQSPEDLIVWVEENMPLEYEDELLYKGYRVLAHADVFLGRVRRRQFYRLWKYATYLMTTGVQNVKPEAKRGFTRYRPPSIFRKLAYTKSKRETYRKILKKIGKYSHMSARKAVEIYPFLKTLLNTLDVERCAYIAAFYDFSKEELEFMTDGKKAEEIHRFVVEHKLHRIEDETFLSGFGGQDEKYGLRGLQDEVESKTEIAETETEETDKVDEGVKKQGKKREGVKHVTLDAFFGED
ncbi:replication factor C large subunit [Geoglobus acetivorans]|uniref:Replication factor C large subunit n=1 Tax=Geoglobus acetivorans TaxID=565033 RepID=A0ABZ3H5P2_GEOAI|nr:replication factor C large subunit [Geoglobus acetivorans]